MADSNQDVLKMLLVKYSGASGIVDYTLFGKIKRIGGMPIKYSILGRLKGIGSGPYILKYDFWGRINQVAIFPVNYRPFSTDIRSVGEQQVGYDAQKRIREIGDLKVNYNAPGNVVAIGDTIFKRSGWLDRIAIVKNNKEAPENELSLESVPEPKTSRGWISFIIIALLLLGAFFVFNSQLWGPEPTPTPIPRTSTPRPEPNIRVCITPTETYAGSSVHIRQEPNLESDEIGTLRYGDVAIATIRNGEGWYSLQPEGYIGSTVVNEVPCNT